VKAATLHKSDFVQHNAANTKTNKQHVQTPLSVRSAMGFLSKTQIWEDSCNHPDDVDSRSDTLIHKASHAFKIQTSGR
jgi:hypothetical protein